VWDQWVGGSNPLSPTTFKETDESRFFYAWSLWDEAKLSGTVLNSALALARRASIEDARNPLLATTFRKARSAMSGLFAFCHSANCPSAV
ncbi:MAG: hypothetical protein ACTH6H_13520, partial [Serratia sp. (in: enterobacteria)]